MLAIHEKMDDMGLGGDEMSLVNGNAGSRIACGIIGVFYSSLHTRLSSMLP